MIEYFIIGAVIITLTARHFVLSWQDAQTFSGDMETYGWENVQTFAGELFAKTWEDAQTFAGELFSKGWEIVQTFAGEFIHKVWEDAQTFAGEFIHKVWEDAQTFISDVEAVLMSWVNAQNFQGDLVTKTWEIAQNFAGDMVTTAWQNAQTMLGYISTGTLTTDTFILMELIWAVLLFTPAVMIGMVYGKLGTIFGLLLMSGALMLTGVVPLWLFTVFIVGCGTLLYKTGGV